MPKEDLTPEEIARRQEIRQKAQQAASADGKNWQSLSREERVVYRKQVREMERKNRA